MNCFNSWRYVWWNNTKNVILILQVLKSCVSGAKYDIDCNKHIKAQNRDPLWSAAMLTGKVRWRTDFEMKWASKLWMFQSPKCFIHWSGSLSVHKCTSVEDLKQRLWNCEMDENFKCDFDRVGWTCYIEGRCLIYTIPLSDLVYVARTCWILSNFHVFTLDSNAINILRPSLNG